MDGDGAGRLAFPGTLKKGSLQEPFGPGAEATSSGLFGQGTGKTPGHLVLDTPLIRKPKPTLTCPPSSSAGCRVASPASRGSADRKPLPPETTWA